MSEIESYNLHVHYVVPTYTLICCILLTTMYNVMYMHVHVHVHVYVPTNTTGVWWSWLYVSPLFSLIVCVQLSSWSFGSLCRGWHALTNAWQAFWSPMCCVHMCTYCPMLWFGVCSVMFFVHLSHTYSVHDHLSTCTLYTCIHHVHCILTLLSLSLSLSLSLTHSLTHLFTHMHTQKPIEFEISCMICTSMAIDSETSQVVSS